MAAPEGRPSQQVEPWCLRGSVVVLVFLDGQLSGHRGMENTSEGRDSSGHAPSPALPWVLAVGLGWHSQAAQVCLHPTTLLAHEGLEGCVDHGTRCPAVSS